MNGLTGDILVKGKIFNGNTNKQDFCIKFQNELLSSDISNNMFVFKDAIMLDGIYFWIVVNFQNGKVTRIELDNADENLKNNYNNWSNYKAKKKKEIHDKWVEEILGKPDIKKGDSLIYNRTWGEATSFEDKKSGQVEIWISYKK
ncbi:hypothetical protein [Peribacillus frigoritolerans]|uniref:hypothetical protein n=1 Tax=Peribacillus frigoritolerans TaxID=450367 RepID=UPI002280FBDE|nr:hypothetical protein [Peribacillus frigoritolerans]MCY9139467.1 hypothetical protein [Peribacillus frigoritolerans]